MKYTQTALNPVYHILIIPGAVENPEVVKIYDIIEAPPYFENIKNALNVYGCSVRNGESNDLKSTLTVVRLVSYNTCEYLHLHKLTNT